MFSTYTTAELEAIAADSKIPGARNSAPYLLKLDTPERRRRAVSEAETLGNLVGGTFSGNVWGAVSNLLELIASGKEDGEMYGERTAREYREREQALREATGDPTAIYYPRVWGAA